MHEALTGQNPTQAPSRDSRKRNAVRDVLIIVVILVPLFVLHARWDVHGVTDATATNAPAWQLVETGSMDVTEYAERNPWFVQGRDGEYFSDRAPGLIALAVPGYALWRVENFVHGPGTLIALLTTLGAALLVWRLTLRFIGSAPAIVAALVFSLGTAAWTVSAAQLWPHGPGQLAALLTVAALASEKYLLAGVATAYAVLARPISAVWAAATGLLEGWRLRNPRVVLRYGAVSSVGLGLVVLYNNWLFSEGILRGGREGVTAGFGSRFTIPWYMENLWETFVGWPNGVLLLSPIVLVGAIGAVRHRDLIPGWAKSAALGGLAYLIVHAGLNRASGGLEILYRYALEPIALSAVALVIGAYAIYQGSRIGRLMVITTATISVVMQAFVVFSMSCRSGVDIMSCQLF